MKETKILGLQQRFVAKENERSKDKVKRAIINGRFFLRYEIETIVTPTQIIVKCLDAPVKHDPKQQHPLSFPKDLVLKLGITNTGINHWVKFIGYKFYTNDKDENIYEYNFNIQIKVNGQS